jgi:hypothetical protein
MKLIVLMALYVGYIFSRGVFYEWLLLSKTVNRYGTKKFIMIVINWSDVFISVNCVAILFSLEYHWWILMNLLLIVLIKEHLEHFNNCIESGIRNAMIHLLIETYYCISTGDRFDQLIGKLEDNLIVDELFSIDGSFDTKLLLLEQKLHNKRYNRLINLIRQMEVYDSVMIIDELDQLIKATMKDDFEEKKSVAEKLSEFYVIPMAINLINMTLMIVYPFIRQWYV